MGPAEASSTSLLPGARYPAPAWLWPRRIPERALTLLAGGVGAGKSFLACDLAARISRGAPWPDRPNESPKQQRVLLLTHEITTGYAHIRLEAARADFRNLEFEVPPEPGDVAGSLSAAPPADDAPPPFHLFRDLARLESFLELRRDIRVVVIDSLTWFLGADGPAKLRASVTRLAELARRRALTIIATIAYRSRPRANRELQALGDQVVVTQSQVIWSLDQPDTVPTSERLLRPIKLSQVHDVTPLRFTLVSGTVDWNQYTEATPSGVVLHTPPATLSNVDSEDHGVQPMQPVLQSAGSPGDETTVRRQCTINAHRESWDSTPPATLDDVRTSSHSADRGLKRVDPLQDTLRAPRQVRGTRDGPAQRVKRPGKSALSATGPPNPQTPSTPRTASRSRR